MKHRLTWHKQTGHAQLNFFLIKSKSVPDNWGVEREREKSTNIELGLRAESGQMEAGPAVRPGAMQSHASAARAPAPAASNQFWQGRYQPLPVRRKPPSDSEAQQKLRQI